VTRTSPIRIEHKYEVFRSEGSLICEGSTTLACVDHDGKIQAMPDWLSQAR
jgi:acyl-CoA thioester hydrolase